MSIRIMSAVWQSAPCEGGTLLVLLALADWADDDGRCFPSVPKIAQKARLGARQVHNIIRELAGDGLLSIEHGGGRHRSNQYRINVESLQSVSVKPNSVKPISLKPATETLQSTTRNPEICGSAIRKNRQEPSIEPPGKQQPAKSKKLLVREELERRDRLREATKRGLRDFSKTPLEGWETQENQAV